MVGGDSSPATGVDVAAAQVVAADGVRVRVYVPEARRGTDGLPEAELTQLARAGAEICTTLNELPRMTVVDGSILLFACDRTDYGNGAVIGRDLPFIPLLVNFLQAESGRPDPDTERHAASPRQPSPLDREVLRQLIAGVKDESAAREMGLALRTYRRAVARVMTLLDARSRFQAGYMAAKHDWL
ncbi:hypothetical protein [Micromonospora inyonensis]|nr:hypothetical protein [Micromonospora inyonensis]